MPISYSRTGDDIFVEHLAAMKEDGADVTIVTTEHKGELVRVATVSWQTHTTTGRLL